MHFLQTQQFNVFFNSAILFCGLLLEGNDQVCLWKFFSKFFWGFCQLTVNFSSLKRTDKTAEGNYSRWYFRSFRYWFFFDVSLEENMKNFSSNENRPLLIEKKKNLVWKEPITRSFDISSRVLWLRASTSRWERRHILLKIGPKWWYLSFGETQLEANWSK